MDPEGSALSAAIAVAESQADPVHGPPRYPVALQRELFRSAVDIPESAAADGDVCVRIRRRAENAIWSGRVGHRIRFVLLGGNAPVARVFGSSGEIDVRDFRAPEFREEAGVPAGNFAGEPGDLGSRNRGVRLGDFPRRIARRAPRHSWVGYMAAALDRAAASSDARVVLVPGRTRDL